MKNETRASQTGATRLPDNVLGGADGARSLLEQHQRLELAAQVGGLGVWDYDILRDEMVCDARWYAIMGLDPGQPIRSVEEFQRVIHPEDRERATEVNNTARQLLSERKDYGIIFRIVRPDGEIRWVRSSACIFDDESGQPVRAVGYVVDITDTFLAEQQLKESNERLQEVNRALQHQATIDPLTGISNRRVLDQELQRACLDAIRNKLPLSAAMIDIDYFKLYNDHYGHQAGDKALCAVAEAIASAAWRPYDLAARYGGEEFCVLLPGTATPETAIERIMANVAALNIEHAFSSAGPRLSISCGCVTTDKPDLLVPERMIEASDRELYRAKEGGRNRYSHTHL